MSATGNLELTLEARHPLPPLTILDALLEAGWTYVDHGRTLYLPLGDDGMYDWTELRRGEDLRSILASKVKLGEPVGVSLTWRDSNVGGSIVVGPGATVWFSALSDRRKLPTSGASDVSWYLERLLPPLQALGYFAGWTWTETN